MTEITKRLAEPFDPAIVSWRVGPTTKDKTKGMALAYIDARDVMRRLDEVCGPENWQDEYPWSDGKRVVCRIGVKIGDEWIWKTDGAGDTDTEGEKGALSDAFKRSAVKWGIGRYLYDVDSPWVQIEQRGNSYVIAKGEYAQLRAMLPRPGKAAPAPARAREADPFSPPPTTRTAPQATRAAALPVNPEESPAVAQQRAAARTEFWKRASYAIDPEIVSGGMAAWAGELLALAEAAPNLDAYLKLRDENKAHFQMWAQSAARPVVDSFNDRIKRAYQRLSKAEGMAA